MAKKPTKPATAAAAPSLLDSIREQTAASGIAYVDAHAAAPLVAAGLIEINPNLRDDAGNVAARPLPTATLKEPEMTTTSPPSATPAASASAFAIEDFVPDMTGLRRRGRQAETYPFAALGVNQSFHVPASAAMPNPAKSLASTVSSAMARYAVETGERENVNVNVYALDSAGKRVKDADGHYVKTGITVESRPVMRRERVFAVVPVDATDRHGPGARVVRTA